MHRISIPPQRYFGIRSGTSSAFVTDESVELLVNDTIILECSEPLSDGSAAPPMECSINALVTHKNEPGLKKDCTIVFVSVIRLLEPVTVASDN